MITSRLVMLLIYIVLSGQTSEPSSHEAVRFASVEVFVDPKGQPLAAYQVEFVADPQRVTLVGIEGGEHPAFKVPPYYDPKALTQNRVILAAFNTGAELPNTRTRVATLHLQIMGSADPEYSVKIEVAGNPQGNPIPADVSLSQGAMR